jgi:RNA polymerase sigma factor (sigma-70 family)
MWGRGGQVDGYDALRRQGFRYALALALERTEAEDLLQDAWSSVLSARGPLHVAYLFRAIRSRWTDRCRRQRVVSFVPMEAPDEVPAEPVSAGEHPELWAALAALREEEREALYLMAVEGWTAQEVADQTGRPRNTVLSLVHRGRAKVRAALQQPQTKVIP